MGGFYYFTITDMKIEIIIPMIYALLVLATLLKEFLEITSIRTLNQILHCFIHNPSLLSAMIICLYNAYEFQVVSFNRLFKNTHSILYFNLNYLLQCQVVLMQSPQVCFLQTKNGWSDSVYYLYWFHQESIGFGSYGIEYLLQLSLFWKHSGLILPRASRWRRIFQSMPLP